MEMEMDRLSALPDSLLFDILNRLGLKEAARTAVLSKQWRFVWTNVPFPFMDESKNIEEIRRFVDMVNASLALRRGPALRSLSVSFRYNDCFASDVDSWLDFAATAKVKDLSLKLESRIDSSPPHIHTYTLPQIIYSISSLTELRLNSCIASGETTVEWRCLKSLFLEGVKLTQQVIGEIVSGCPVLETLNLVDCNGFNRLEIGSRSFHSLWVQYYCGKGLLEISAPYMRILYITVCGTSIHGGNGRRIRKVRLQNVASLERAYINVFEHEKARIFFEPYMQFIPVETMQDTIEILQDLSHFKSLHFSKSSTKVVSVMATNGWQLPRLKVECLIIEAVSHAHFINGVVAILESSPYLEKLLIRGCEPEKVPIIWGPITRVDLRCNTLHLKTVVFADFVDSDISGEPILTLAQILLRRAPILETMAIHTFLSTEETDFIKKALLSYPKSSTEVYIGLGPSNARISD